MIKYTKIFDAEVSAASSDDGIVFGWSGGVCYIAVSGNDEELTFRLHPMALIPDAFAEWNVPFPRFINGTALFAVDMPAANYQLTVANNSVSSNFAASVYILSKV